MLSRACQRGGAAHDRGRATGTSRVFEGRQLFERCQVFKRCRVLREEPTAREPTAANAGADAVGASFRWGWSGLILLATVLPYLIAYSLTPAGCRYTWILPPYPGDSMAYLAWSRQALDGEWLLRFKYTTLPHDAFLVQPFFLVAGWLGRLTGWDLGVVHLILKSIGVLLFWKVFFDLLRALRVPPREQRVAAVLAGVASGVGALYLKIFGGGAGTAFHPADLWLVDLNVFWSLLWNPLFPWSLALVLLAVRWILQGTETGKRSFWWKGGAATGALALIHPYPVPFLYLFCAVLIAVRLPWREWLRAGVRFYGISGPFAAYVAWRNWSEPILRMHATTGAMKSPSLPDVLLGCGLLAIFAALAVFGLARERSALRRLWPLLLWVGLSLCLAYAPVWFQRKSLFGLQLPLCILAAFGIVSVLRRPIARWLVIGIMATTPAFLVQHELRGMRRVEGVNPYFVSDDLVAALHYLRGETLPETIVFASEEVSSLVPALAGNTVVWGHWAQSVDREAQRARYLSVFDPSSGWSDERRAVEFAKTGIRYVLLDPTLRSFMEGTVPEWLRRDSNVVWRRGAIEIVELTRVPAGS